MRRRSSAVPSALPTRPAGTSTRVDQSPPESRSTDFRTSASGALTRFWNRNKATIAMARTKPSPAIGQYAFSKAAIGLLASPGARDHHTALEWHATDRPRPRPPRRARRAALRAAPCRRASVSCDASSRLARRIRPRASLLVPRLQSPARDLERKIPGRAPGPGPQRTARGHGGTFGRRSRGHDPAVVGAAGREPPSLGHRHRRRRRAGHGRRIRAAAGNRRVPARRPVRRAFRMARRPHATLRLLPALYATRPRRPTRALAPVLCPRRATRAAAHVAQPAGAGHHGRGTRGGGRDTGQAARDPRALRARR